MGTNKNLNLALNYIFRVGGGGSGLVSQKSSKLVLALSFVNKLRMCEWCYMVQQ